MSSIGERLRQERLRRGLELDQIAERTRISSRFLQAIEAEDLDKLPGGFFTRSFMRQYAQFLDLDDPDLDAELERLTGSPEPALPPEPLLSRQFDLAPISSSRKTLRLDRRRALGSLIGFLAVVLVCSGLYALWQRPWHVPTPAPAPPPNAQAQPPVAAPHTLPPQPTPPPPSAQPQPPVAAPETSTAPPQPPPAAAAASSEPRASEGGPSPSSAVPIVLEIRATEEVWIRVSADGKYLYSGTLQPGQTKTFQGQTAMSLLTGNAGGMEIGFNGKPLGPIGPKGQIRTVEFTPQGYQIIERKPPPPPDVF